MIQGPISMSNILSRYWTFSLLSLDSHESVMVRQHLYINSSPPNAAYTCQIIERALVQIMACHLFSTEPLSEPMLAYCQLDHSKQSSVKFQSRFNHFHAEECIWKCCLENGSHFCPAGNELRWPKIFCIGQTLSPTNYKHNLFIQCSDRS